MKRLLLLLFVTSMTLFSFSQNDKFQLSTHVLDVSEGRPAANVRILLEKKNKKNEWTKVAESKTDNNGRIGDFLKIDKKKSDQNNGIYRLTFYTEEYFEGKSIETFYPFVQVVFVIKDDSHYHVPITLSPFGYSTYRGS